MELRGGWAELRTLAVDWPGEQAISGSERGVLNHWDLHDGVCLRRMEREKNQLMDGISCIAVDWSTMNAYTGGITGQLRLWHVGERPCLLDEDAHSTQVRCLCVDIQDAPRQSRE